MLLAERTLIRHTNTATQILFNNNLSSREKNATWKVLVKKSKIIVFEDN